MFDATLPLERARTIPSGWYLDEEIYQAEQRRVFAQTWQCVGRTDQLGEAGSFLTADIGGEPILVVRGEDQQLRAFSNVCRHRAAKVVPEACGRVAKLRCRYHGWTYDLAGKLRGVPEFDGVEGFARDANGLPGWHVATWGPLVFVHGGTSPRALLEFLDPVPSHRSTQAIDRLHFVERRVYDLACNWKVFVDNYLDGGYHVNTIHPSLSSVLDYSQYRTELTKHASVQVSPMRQPDPQHEDASAAQVRTGDAAYYWWVFPNLMINLYAGIMDTNLVLPLGPDRCRVIFDFFFGDAATPNPEGYQAESMAVGHQIQLEDVGICEEVQRGLASRSFDTGRYSVRREAGVYHFHRLLAHHLRTTS
jgi:choline monooxygenase